MMIDPLHYIIVYKISYTLQYVVPMAVKYSYCTPDGGYGKCTKHIESSCNKIKILLHLLDILCVHL
jgi:hypothetical protein